MISVLIAALLFAEAHSAPDSAAKSPAAAGWTEFRGPNGTGVAADADPPTKWSETENVRWKTPINYKGWSSPVVADGRVWLTTATEDAKELYAVCVDFETGKVLHDIKLFDVETPQFVIPFNSAASSTPVILGDRVFVHYGSPGTACLDARTATVLWKRTDLPCDHHRGAGSSPIVVDDRLILTFDGFDLQYVVALDCRTGETVWRTDRGFLYERDDGDIKKAYSTPALFELHGRRQLVSPSAQATVSLDPATGREWWRVNHGGMNAPARPVLVAGMLVVNTGTGGDRLLAIRPDGSGDVTESHVAWKSNQGIPTMANPLVVGDRLYLVADNGVASCLRGDDGRRLWQQRLPGEFTASPVAAKGRIYFCNRTGNTRIVADSENYEELASNDLDDGCMATPALVGNSLLLRTRTHLYRIESQGTNKGANRGTKTNTGTNNRTK